MAATDISIYTLVVPNPDYPQNDQDFGPLPTLSSNTVQGGDDVKGLLYVPDLAPNDACVDLSKPFIPNNVTRQANLPAKDYYLIALAPWISANCTLNYLASAAKAQARGFLFYPTDHRPNPPPPLKDQMWNLNDGGRWKSRNLYPVWAIPGSIGDDVMSHLSHYSGNMSVVDYGDQLTQQHDPRDYARLYVQVGTAKRVILPSLWVFLLIVLAALLVIIGITSVILHCVQRKRRENLQRRVAAGEVDLEALGIKRLHVPKERLDKMELFVYVNDDQSPTTEASLPSEPEIAQTKSTQDAVLQHESPDRPSNETSRKIPDPSPQPSKSLSLTSLALPYIETSKESCAAPLSPPLPPSPTLAHTPAPNPISAADLSHRSPSHSQKLCSICLEDLVSHQTVVRELPCGHVFDPECIDEFLLKRSSLCPLCKTSVLPQGYCPEAITNNMVRRERMVRRLRAQAILERSSNGVGHRAQFRRSSLGRNLAGFNRHFGSAARYSRSVRGLTPSAVEMTNTVPAYPAAVMPASSTPLPSVATADGGRRELARRRASAMLRQNPTLDEAEDERITQTPRWRKAIGRIFPTAL
ncbi:MAG: hypothetical protein M4579_005704 [Chaenotheca gracillima]|nr:MAG: hypothetical protein M4579_005704 [Chaenotheca gracillima]